MIRVLESLADLDGGRSKLEAYKSRFIANDMTEHRDLGCLSAPFHLNPFSSLESKRVHRRPAREPHHFRSKTF